MNNYKNRIEAVINSECKGGDTVKSVKIKCKFCENLLFTVHKRGKCTIEIICPTCGETLIITLKSGDTDG